jgi:hypothetical protein
VGIHCDSVGRHPTRAYLMKIVVMKIVVMKIVVMKIVVMKIVDHNEKRDHIHVWRCVSVFQRSA